MVVCLGCPRGEHPGHHLRVSSSPRRELSTTHPSRQGALITAGDGGEPLRPPDQLVVYTLSRLSRSLMESKERQMRLKPLEGPSGERSSRLSDLRLFMAGSSHNRSETGWDGSRSRVWGTGKGSLVSRQQLMQISMDLQSNTIPRSTLQPTRRHKPIEGTRLAQRWPSSFIKTFQSHHSTRSFDEAVMISPYRI